MLNLRFGVTLATFVLACVPSYVALLTASGDLSAMSAGHARLGEAATISEIVHVIAYACSETFQDNGACSSDAGAGCIVSLDERGEPTGACDNNGVNCGECTDTSGLTDKTCKSGGPAGQSCTPSTTTCCTGDGTCSEVVAGCVCDATTPGPGKTGVRNKVSLNANDPACAGG
jgi:hypothetical protein